MGRPAATRPRRPGRGHERDALPPLRASGRAPQPRRRPVRGLRPLLVRRATTRPPAPPRRLRRSLVALTMTSAEREEFLAGLHVGILERGRPRPGAAHRSGLVHLRPRRDRQRHHRRAERQGAAPAAPPGGSHCARRPRRCPTATSAWRGRSPPSTTRSRPTSAAPWPRATSAPRAPSSISPRRSRMPREHRRPHGAGTLAHGGLREATGIGLPTPPSPAGSCAD